MNQILNDLIKNLSINDTKSLSQKALKTCEEAGELAKVVLPFENAFATQHRFVDKKAILEEVADVILTVQSIAYDLGFSYDELEEMVHHKALYWAELQNRDKEAKFPLPYEIHITIKNNEGVDLEKFKQTCLNIGVKPILIDLENNSGDLIFQDLMTSSVHLGNNSSSYQEMNRIISELSINGFNVIRSKIETVPWHPAAPCIKYTGKNYKMPQNCYFEAHLAVVTQEAQLEKLREIVKQFDNCHLSKNSFKKIDHENFIMMITKRASGGVIEMFKIMTKKLKENLINEGYLVDKVITEFAIYDTKISHDNSWITA